MAISTLDRLKTVLGYALGDTTQDLLLTQMLNGASAAAETYCKRKFVEAARTEYYDGTNSSILLLNQRPVSAVSEVRVDLQGHYGTRTDSFGTETILTSGLDYALEFQASGNSNSGAIRRIAGPGSAVSSWPVLTSTPGGPPVAGSLSEGRSGPVWVAIPGSIRVTYTAGYSALAMPEDLMSAVDGLACMMLRTQKFGGSPVQSEALGAASYSLAVQMLATMAPVGTPRQILNSYREMVI